MKRVNTTLPIYSSLKNGLVPDTSVYVLADDVKGQYWYCGTTTQPTKRYKRYLRATKKPAHESHESLVKIDRFKHALKYNEDGNPVSPVMIIIDNIPEDANPNELEKQYRDKYTSAGMPLINPTGKYKTSLHQSVKYRTHTVVDYLFSVRPLWWYVLSVVVLITVYAMIRVGGNRA